MHIDSFHDKNASKKNEQKKKRLILKGSTSTKGCNRVELDRIELYSSCLSGFFHSFLLASSGNSRVGLANGGNSRNSVS